jgi:glycosyltransferase involved in cell wall biosynthesis
MHIAIYHDACIPPRKYGGTERIIYWLAKALVQLEHQVTLIAQEGSHAPGTRFIAIPRSHPGSKMPPWEELIPEDADIVHLWSTPQPFPKKPFLVTIEGNGQLGEHFHSNTVFVSRKHAENHGSQCFVHNGIDPSDFQSEPVRDNYLVFLAKASWKVKNVKGACEVAKKAGIPLKIMGSRVRSWIPWRGIEYLGMVDDIRKRQVLKQARALLFPVRWHEPFGIAITEALASGCPVYGTPYGSLPEIVTPEVGHLSNRLDELVEAVLTQSIAPEKCIVRVHSGFTHLDMARRYLSLYTEVLTQGSLNQKAETLGFRGLVSAETLLPWHSSN